MKLTKTILVLLLAVLILCGSGDAWAAKKKKPSSKSSKAKAAKYIIALDAGHADNTPGKRSCPYGKEVTHTFRKKTVTVRPGEQFKEHWANVGIAVELEKILKKHGFKVVRIGWNDDNATDDQDTHEFDRQARIKEAGANIVVSIHYNAAGNGSEWHGGIGLETYYWTGNDQSRILAEHVHNQLIATTGQVNRGVKANQFWMTDCGKMGCNAACLVEHAFMTNEGETYEYFSNPEAWFNYATATARGICNFTNIPYKGPKPTKQASEPNVPEGRANF